LRCDKWNSWIEQQGETEVKEAEDDKDGGVACDGGKGLTCREWMGDGAQGLDGFHK